MKQFIAKYAEQINGTLSGFDRLVFRGTLRALSYDQGMKDYLSNTHVLLKDFKEHVYAVSERLKTASLAAITALGRTVKYVASSAVNKEALARAIADKEKITEGPVCVLTCVEPCRSFDIYRNREAKRLEVVARPRKCLFLYHYSIHPEFGFMNARIQTWFPFPIQICLNGREWLSRQMEAAGLEYLRAGNCFAWIADFERAQALMEEQRAVHWADVLDCIAHELNPIHLEIFRAYKVRYYWSTYQSEWATDIVFNDASVLKRLFPHFVHHAMTTFSSPEVMRFLGRKIPLTGIIPARFQGEVVTDIKQRQEGVRIKHRLDGNAIKAYDKAYTQTVALLRVEATVNNVKGFKAYRPKEGEPDGPCQWRAMRRGVADLYRRTEVSQHANERYLDALASTDDTTTLEELLVTVEQHTTWNGKRVRGLHPFTREDGALFQAIGRGEFTLNGFRNKDLQARLFDTPAANPQDARRRSAQVSRKLRLLRAHGLIKKVSNEHRYYLTQHGRKVVTASLAARQASVNLLTAKAA